MIICIFGTDIILVLARINVIRLSEQATGAGIQKDCWYVIVITILVHMANGAVGS